MAIFRRGRYRGVEEREERGVVSDSDWQRPAVRRGLRVVHLGMLVLLLIVGLGPILWLAKSAVTPTQDTLRTPMALWPHGIDLDNLATAWNRVHIDRYFGNTIMIAAGSWLVQIVVATTGGYALSVLRPRYAPVITALVLATLFVPAVVLLVPLYLTILDTPLLHVNLINTFWAVWLPAGASALNVIIVKRFFDNLPREVFEAARTDGAGPFRLFWSIVLPMSRPVLGVVSVFADHRDLEGLPVALAGVAEPRGAASVRAPADPAAGHGAGRVHGRPGHLDAHPHRHLPRPAAHVPARRRSGRCRQGVAAQVTTIGRSTAMSFRSLRSTMTRNRWPTVSPSVSRVGGRSAGSDSSTSTPPRASWSTSRLTRDHRDAVRGVHIGRQLHPGRAAIGCPGPGHGERHRRAGRERRHRGHAQRGALIGDRVEHGSRRQWQDAGPQQVRMLGRPGR